MTSSIIGILLWPVTLPVPRPGVPPLYPLPPSLPPPINLSRHRKVIGMYVELWGSEWMEGLRVLWSAVSLDQQYHELLHSTRPADRNAPRLSEQYFVNRN